AIQLLPSIAYSSTALRTLGIHNAVGNEKIPYAYLSDHYALPHGIACLLVPFGFGGAGGRNEFLNPYIGVFPLLLVVIAIWKNWKNPWVRYLFFLGLAAYLYSFGPFSPLHGVLYALVPELWVIREPARMLYLAGFALALLAGFGAEILLARQASSINWTGLRRVGLGFVLAGGLAIAVPAVYGRPAVNPWVSLSILLIFLTYALFRTITSGPSGRTVRLLVIGLILLDLSAFDWSSRNRIEVAQSGVDQWVKLMSCRGAVRFLKTLPGPFRVELTDEQPPNIGDVFSILTNGGSGATVAIDYARLSARLDLLNVKYRLEPASSSSPSPLYQDSAWKIYENPAAYPHAWLVHQASVEPSTIKAFDRVNDPGIDLRQTAIVDSPPAEPLGTPSAASDQIQFVSYGINRLELAVQSQSGGLLILSENYDSAWKATVNGRSAKVYRADGALRSVAVPTGSSRVIFEYAPRSVWMGAMFSLLTLLGVCTALILFRRAQSAQQARLSTTS
ncbi:MAG: YfhO family protein, partial [Bryobacteraceae bacterium]